MIHRIEIVGLGPHRRFAAELSPDGTTVISGPSEIGKSTILEAILLGLLGRGTVGRFRPELIHERAENAGVRITLNSGLIIERGFSRTRPMKRAIITPTKRRSISSEKAMAREIGIVGEDPEIALMVMVPLYWQPMIAANARPFRDALARILPPADTAAIIKQEMASVGHTVSDEEAGWTEKQALAARRGARKALDEAVGSLTALRAQQERLQQPLPATGAVPHEQIVAAERAAAEALHELTEHYRVARRQQEQLSERLSAFDLTTPDRCPTCSRGGWSAGAQQVAALQVDLAGAEQQLAAATQAGAQARQAHNEALAALAESQQAAGAARQRQADLQNLQSALTASTAAVESRELEANRLDALVNIIREAPSQIAAQQATALGDLGPVSLTFSNKPAVSVLIDGRPWWLASRGRQVVADIHLRSAIRRAAGLHHLPIVVDNVQDVGGQPIPRIVGSGLILRTTDETAISIRRLLSADPSQQDGAGQNT